MHLTIPPDSIRPVPAEVQEALERLRAEAEQTEDPESKAILLHEIGFVEELAGDDHSAARDLLLAVNTDTTLREPLEQLCFLLERRGSYKNLSRLLERMIRVSQSDEEKARAHEAMGDFAADQGGEPELAKRSYAAVRALGVPGVNVELAMQLVAIETSDLASNTEALALRAGRAEDETYRAALLLSLSRLQLENNQPAEAQLSLERASSMETPVRLQALCELERLARLCGDRELFQKALLAQAELLEAASRDQALRRKHGIDVSELSAARRADAWLRASQACDRSMRQDDALALTQKARALLPSDACLLHRLLERSDQLPEAQRRALVAEELEAATDPLTISSLALVSARDALAANDPETALAALERSLEHEPDSALLRALEFDLLLARPRPTAVLPRAAERLGDLMHEGEPRGAMQWVTALLYAALGEEGQEPARALLTRALASGYDSNGIGRTSRALALRFHDARWYLDATQRVLKGASLAERPGLLLDLVRTSWVLGDDTAAIFNLEEAASSEAGAWVAAVLTCYGSGTPGSDSRERGERSLRALTRIAALTLDPDRSFALRQLAATLRAGAGRTEPALEQFEELHAERPSDPVVAASLAALRRGDASARAQILAHSADECRDPQLAFSLHLQAAIADLRNGNAERGIRSLRKAHAQDSAATSALLSWALRRAHPNDPEDRRLTLGSMKQAERDAKLYALERFGLEVGSAAGRADATRALDEAPADTESDLDQALWLARALWPAAQGHGEGLRLLAKTGATGRDIARALAFFHERKSDSPSQETLKRLAAEWAASGSLLGALEWLGAAVCSNDSQQELLAREQIAKELGASAAASVRAGTLLVAWLGGQVPQLLAATSKATCLANLETAPPGCDARRRAHALRTAGPALSNAGENAALLLAGYNHIVAGADREALAAFHEALTLVPEDLVAWEGIRLVANRLGNVGLEADALHKLATLSHLPGKAAELERQRAELLAESGDELGSREALERAVELDIEHFDSFNRLFRRYRGEKRYDKVLALADRRLAVTNDAREVAKLCWERARAHRGLGNMEAALSDLDTVRVLDPEHPGPLALGGEIFVTMGKLEEAAEQLASLAAMGSAPADQRQMSGIAAADLYAGKLGRLPDAISVLSVLRDAGQATLASSERLAKFLAEAERWEEAVAALETLMDERPTQDGRVEAARLAMAICRDQLHTPDRALWACSKLLADAPADGEALDYILEGELDSEGALSLLRRAREALLDALPQRHDPARTIRLMRIAHRLGDSELRLLSGGVVMCTEQRSPELEAELRELVARCPKLPKRAFDDAELRTLFPRVTDHPIGELCRLLAPTLSVVLTPNPKSLSLGRRDRLKPQAAPELFAELEAWAAAVGARDFEVFVGGAHDGILIFPGEKSPTLVLGPGIKAPLSREQHAELARKFTSLPTGTTFVLDREPNEVAAVINAACALGDVALPWEVVEPPELRKALGKELPRRVRKALPELAERIRRGELEPLTWLTFAEHGLDRARALVLGDVSLVLLDEEQRSRGETVLGHFLDKQERRFADLSRFATSRALLELRRRLGFQHP